MSTVAKPRRKRSKEAMIRRRAKRFVRYRSLIEQAKPYTNSAGLVVKKIPAPLFDELRKKWLTVSGGDLLPPNLEGLTSRWWLISDLAAEKRIHDALWKLRRRRAAAEKSD